MPALSNLYREMATSRDGFLAQFNLTRPQLELLISLKETPQTTSSLANKFYITSSAVSQMVDQLIEKKLVERVESVNDRRVAHIQLSENGTVLFANIHHKFLNHLEEKFKTVSIKEIEELLTIIRKVTEDVSKEQTWKE